MSVINFEKETVSNHSSKGEMLLRSGLIVLLFVVALLALSITRIFGHKSNVSLFKEAKQTAYATIGYAFKY